MRIRRLLTAGLCLAAGLAGTALAAPAAQAAPPLSGKQYVSAATAVSTTTTKTVSAKCPTGKVIISGGAYVDGPITVKLTATRPIVTANSWEAAARNTYGRAAPWRLYAFAICANEPAGIDYLTAEGTNGGTPQSSAPIACPQGKQILGVGGLAAKEPGRNVTLDWVVPVSTVGAHSGSLAAQGGEPLPWTSVTYAICASNLGATVVGGPGPTDSSTSKVDGESCGTGKLAAVGGAIVTSADYQEGQIFLYGIYPDPTLTSGTVIANEDHDGYAGSWWLNTWVICA